LNALSHLDIGVFACYMLLLVGVGVWFTRRQTGLKSYLLADQNIHWVIVAVSVLAALFSGITYLGAPAEAFFYDLGYLWVVVSFFIATPITTLLFLPFFRSLNLYTAYEYLERRFDRRLCWVASALFIGRVSLYLGLAIYAPALAIMEITGWPFALSVVLTGAAATLYTTLGGMKAVIWTDSIQFLVLCGGVVVVLGYAIAAVPGGLPAAWNAAAADGKARFVNWSLDPGVRITVWGGLLGGACANLVQMVTDQIAVQRYLTAPSLRDSQRALWFKLWVTLPLVALFYLTGTILYGYYRTLPERAPAFQKARLVPLLASPEGQSIQRAPIANDCVLPYFVVRELPSPLPGLLIAAVLGATMAVVSAGVNSLATTALMDFRRKPEHLEGSAQHQLRLARFLTLLFGTVATLLALFVMEHLGTLLQATNRIMGLFGGPLLGVFFLGVLARRANGSGALIGAAGGVLTAGLVAFSGPLFRYEISFLWIAFSAAAVTFTLGLLASLFFAAPGPAARALVYRRGATGESSPTAAPAEPVAVTGQFGKTSEKSQP
jgi:sodium-coupled monocarboxylate transporter 8/12